jgi:hypothetical protein
LYDKSATAALNRQNFTLLATAAISAAQFETPSMRFYKGGNVTATSGSAEKQKYLDQYEAAETGASLFTLPMPGEKKEDVTIPIPHREQ